MRQPSEKQLGVLGETRVKAAFIDLAWGVATATEFDVGTDLFLLVRDSHMFDLGMLVGAQVKTGDSFFSHPVRDNQGETTGWWFCDTSGDHVDYWLNHTLPHLIVLHDHHHNISYWARISTETVVRTGAGAKVFVPRANTVDRNHLDALLEVAASARPPSVWEGSAWTGDTTLAARDILRHAMIAPRLVAPHRSAGTGSPLTAAQAIALLVDARVHDVERFAARHDHVPRLEEAVDSPDWEWRFVAAMGVRVTTGDPDPLLSLVWDAPSASTRAAAAVAAAAALLEQVRPQQAYTLLQDVLALDHAPVDEAWLTLHHGRACWELGHTDEARAAAVRVQKVRLTHADDVTATAIAGAGALLLFATATWHEQDVQQAITGSDTTASWWRTQATAAGATAVIDREFNSWAGPRSVTLFGEDVAHNRLFSAAQMANHLGDHDAWRRLQSTATQQSLLTVERTTPARSVSGLLSELRAVGNDRALRTAVARLLEDGPAESVTQAAADIDLARSTRTTAIADLELLAVGGDVADPDTSHAAVTGLLDVLAARSPGMGIARIAPDTRPVLAALAGVAPAAGDADHDAIADLVLALGPCGDEVLASSWARLVVALPQRTWTEDLAARAVASAQSHHDRLRRTLLAVAARAGNQDGHDQLIELAGAGSIQAALALGDLGQLPDNTAVTLLDQVSDQVRQQIDGAQCGMAFGWDHDPGQVLTWLNISHPSVARWDTLYALLQAPGVDRADTRGAWLALTVVAEDLSDPIRSRLAPMALAALEQPDGLPRIGDWRPSGMGPAALVAVTLADDHDVAQDILSRLLAGGDDDRAWAAPAALRLGFEHAVGVLVSLAHDPCPLVRANAAAGLARMIATDEAASPVVLGAVRGALGDPGVLVPLAIARTIANASGPSEAARAVLADLLRHRSAAVREVVQRWQLHER